MRWIPVLPLLVAIAGCAVDGASFPDHVVGVTDDVALHPVADGVWRHVTLGELDDGSLYPANGLVIRGDGGSVLVDTGWTDAHAETLLAWARLDLLAPVTAVVVTHAHRDRAGGLGALRRAGVEVLVVPRAPEDGPLVVERGGVRIELFHPGAAHAPGNVVVWLPSAKVLFGGCAVRAAGASGPGNLADADVDAWPAAVDRLAARYADATIVVPGHGRPGGVGLLEHTRRLVTADAGVPTP